MSDTPREFSHAYLICGGSSDRRREILIDYLYDIIMKAAPDIDGQLLLSRLKDNSYADIYYINKDNTSVKIESVRAVASYFALMPADEAPVRFAVINDAEAMTAEAQNALLKILEEPPSDRYIFLSADSSDNLLPTILSRVQKIKVSEGSYDEKYDESDIIYLYDRICRILTGGDIAAVFDTAAEIAKEKDRANARLEALYGIFRSIILAKSGVSSDGAAQFGMLCEHIGINCALSIAQIINQAFSAVAANVPLRLVWENLLISVMEEYNAENSRNTL